MKHGSQFSPYSLLRSIWNHKMLVAGIWLAVTLGVVAMVMRLPRTYAAEAVVLIERPRIPEKMVASAVQEQLQDRLEQIKQKALSYGRVVKLMEQFNLYESERKGANLDKVIETFKDDLKMKLDRGWGTGSAITFRISFQGRDPKSTAEVVNHVARYFANENRSERQGDAKVTADFMKQKLDEAKRQMDEAQARLNTIKLNFNGELPQQEPALLAMVGQSRTQLQGIQDSLNRAHQNKLILNSNLELAKAAETQIRGMSAQYAQARQAAARAAAMGQASPATAARVPLSVTLAAELERLQDRYGDGHPDVRRKLAQLNEAKAEEARESASAPAAVRAAAVESSVALLGPDRDFTLEINQAHERVETIRTQITVANNEVTNLERERQRLAAELAGLESRIGRLPLREQQMAGFKLEFENAKANHDAIRDRAMTAGMADDVEKDQKGEQFTLLDPARTPTEPVAPKRTLLALAGALFGLLAGALGAVGIDMKRDVFMGEWELPAGTPVLGRVVYIPAGSADVARATKWA